MWSVSYKITNVSPYSSTIMSYTVTFYLADISKLRSVMGSKNASLLKEMEEPDDDEIQFVETLLMGTKQDEDYGADYGYTLERIVAHLFGDCENVPEFEGLRCGEFDDPPLDWLLLSGPPVTLLPYGDFPYVGHLFLKDIQKMLKEWKACQIDEYTPEIQTQIEGMLGVFKNAVKKKKDVISFYY